MFYICTITEQIGEYEFSSKILLDSNDIDEDLLKVCREYRGNDVEPDEDGNIWSDNIVLDTNNLCYEEVTKEEFEVLKKYLVVL